MCMPIVVMIFVPDVNKIGAIPIATHALGSAGVLGPWKSHKAHLCCQRARFMSPGTGPAAPSTVGSLCQKIGKQIN